jgi:hypothetical protein
LKATNIYYCGPVILYGTDANIARELSVRLDVSRLVGEGIRRIKNTC